MKYVLFLWITECVGFGCPVPMSLQQPYVDQGACEEALDVAMTVAGMTKKKYAGICLPEDAAKRINEEWGKAQRE